MKFSEAWLREWVKPDMSRERLLETLTLAGLEVDGVDAVTNVSGPFVVGYVKQVVPHPNADRLRVCEVDVAEAQPFTIVCGAPNVVEGAKVIVALPGAVTAQGLKIQPNQIRGVDSHGMLVSEEELGLAEHSEGLWILSETELQVGADVLAWLNLKDVSIEVDLTPNRGDCLSVQGIAREVSALTDTPLEPIAVSPWLSAHETEVAVRIEAKAACPAYHGCLIKGVNPKAKTPLWMYERLRRSGVRLLKAVVDVTNYVLLELGQPLHAFDANKLQGDVHVRFARKGETLVLLDEKVIILAQDDLIIADERGPIALAGVMGGLETAVDDQTTDVFLECAYFSPMCIAGRARQYGLHTDASHRFERGVDPGLQARAMQRAVTLLCEIVGGQAGPETVVRDEALLPRREWITLTHESLQAVLGVSIPAAMIERKFQALGCSLEVEARGWQVQPPSHRFDLTLEEDLIEEVARLYGYNNLPATLPEAGFTPLTPREGVLPVMQLQRLLAASGFQEVITYSFVSEEWQSLLDPMCQPLRLQNPISSEMGVMRTSLWPGLLRSALYNQNRRHAHIRLFEVGQVFRGRQEDTLYQGVCVGGVWTGEVTPEQWGLPKRWVDFYDLKGQLETVLAACGHATQGLMTFRFVPEHHPALHPGQSARIDAESGESGWIGRLHPVLEKKLGFEGAVFVFELPLEVITTINIPRFNGVSRFPAVRRDLALVVNETVLVDKVCDIIRAECGTLIKDLTVFDVFRGGSVPSGKKSLALGIILQSSERTLKDDEVNTCVEKVVVRLKNDLNAQLRE